MRLGKHATGIAPMMLLLLSGCGSGDDGGGTGGTGVTRKGASVGVIAEKSAGDVTVNGVRFNGAGARVTIDGASATLDALAVGMVAKVRGSIRDDGTGAAQSIDYLPTVIGPIEDIAAERLTVLRQTVVFSAATVCHDAARGPIACNTLEMNDTLEVSGLTDEIGDIQASFIERRAPGITPYRARGKISTLNTLTQTFAIDTLQVQYTSATGDTDQLENGRSVSAVGSLSAPGLLVANHVTVLRSVFTGEQEGDEAEVEGYVSAVHGPGHFVLDGETVQGSDRTEYRGVAAQEIAVGMRLEVEGVLANGVVNARRVELRSRD